VELIIEYVVANSEGTSENSATVHCGQDIITDQVIVIKLEEAITNNPVSSLQHEYSVLTQLQGVIGFSQPLWFSREGSYHVMVLENLGQIGLSWCIQIVPCSMAGVTNDQ